MYEKKYKIGEKNSPRVLFIDQQTRKRRKWRVLKASIAKLISIFVDFKRRLFAKCDATSDR